MKLKFSFDSCFLFLVVLLLALLTLNYEYGELRISPYTNYGYTLLLVLSIIGAYTLVKLDFKIYYNPVIFYLFTLFSLTSVLTYLLYGNVLTALVLVGSQVLVFLSVSIMYSRFNTRLLDNLIFTLLIFTLFVGTLSILAYFHGSLELHLIPIDNEHTARLSGMFGSSNRTSSVFAIGILILVYYTKSKKRLGYKWVLVLCYLLLCIGLILTGSRGSWIALVIATLYLTFKYSDSKLLYLFKSLLWSLFIVFLIVMSIFLLIENGVDVEYYTEELVRLESFEKQINIDNEGAGRAYYWRRAYEVFTGNDLFPILVGSGDGSLKQEIGKSAHSGFLNVIVDRGMISFILLLLLLSTSFLMSSYDKSKKKMGFQLISAIILYSSIKNFTNNEIPSNNYIGILFIVFLAIIATKPNVVRNIEKV